MILFALATFGAAVVAFVLYPVFSSSREAEIGNTGASERELIALQERKARLYDAISDLDFEKDAGKVSAHDYQTARNDYLAQVAEILTRIDALTPAEPEKAAGKGKKAEKKTEGEGSRLCPACGKPSRAGAKFCMHCGSPFDGVCAECGGKLPAEARFCMSCGHKVSA